MSFAHPEFLLLFPALLVLGLVWRRLRLFRPLRLLLLALLTLLLADPHHSRQQKVLDLWVLLDRSDSTEDLIDRGLPEWRELLEKSRPGRKDRLRFIDYGAEVIAQEQNDRGLYTGSRKLTRTGLAIQNALALAEDDRPARVLAFTDGFATESLAAATAQLKARGVPLDYRLVRDETTDDYALTRLVLPDQAQSGEPFVLSLTVRGAEDKELPLKIYRNDQLLSETLVTLVNGVAQSEFTDRLAATGSYHYRAEIVPAAAEPPIPDAHPGNNGTERWITITGGPRVLLVSKYEPDPLEQVLVNQSYTLDVVRDPATLRPGQLSGAKAVIFNNVPAFEIPGDFLAALPFYVQEQGGGFLMAGGKQSFGAGGYFQSALDELLPVSMELKNEHRKLSVAMAVIIDRSGSMAMTVPAAGKPVTKMQLANNGTAEAIKLLGAMDEVALLAVDSEPHRILPLTRIGNRKNEFIDKALRMQSQGGGIFVYRGLKAAWDQLKTSQVGTKHIILFSDAADSEEPGNYKTLLQEMENAGATVSVIGLGTKADPDAALLEDIATRGNGRIFFTDKPLDIPKLFAQETVTIARSAFLNDPVGTLASGRGAEIFQKEIAWLEEVDGYNLSYARPEATTLLVAQDEYLAPLVAHARRGLGRTMAISFPLGGEFSQRTRQWPGYGDFLQSVTNWLAGDAIPPGLGLRHRLEGTTLTLDLHYDLEEWDPIFALHPPVIKLLDGEGSGQPYEVTWQRLAPGHFSLTRELEEGAVIRGAVQAGPHAFSFGPLAVGSSTEWDFDPTRLAELRATSLASGGRELLDLSQAWQHPPLTASSDLRVPLALAALLLMLADALITRMGWHLPQFAFAKKTTAKRTRQPVKATATAHQATEPSKETPSQRPQPTQPSAQASSNSRSSRFDRAKRRR
ncbi:vWA domain-containing protein [Roseibacillus ishigakijimensis]|uniref:VWA domain-containing protein n=1 Tax=Roseibacillus ishigakijimensis TaxID=454146 RepID=A0A934RTF9_9BACT|nr:VWA domain-containing protein [Roseibacillus ishigakijimensis]MBK1834744.1 VWA domain-containing protein [Roseibacillus ishigakijimensis]